MSELAADTLMLGERLEGRDVILSLAPAASRWSLRARDKGVLAGVCGMKLPAKIGWAAGGEVPVATDNNSQGDRTLEPFFEVRGDLVASTNVVLLDGRSGQARFRMDPEPLLPRWFRSLRQLLQKRYEI